MSATASSWSVILLFGGAGLFLAVFIFVVVGLLMLRRSREFKHLERMKAIENGFVLPDGPPSSKTHMEMVTSIAVGVPAITFGLAFVGGLMGAAAFAWPAAGAVSVAAVICATILAYQRPAPSSVPQRPYSAKPAVEPDAYDVAGSRG